MHANMIAVARARVYARLLTERPARDLGIRKLVQIALIVPRLLSHIDGQASMLGNPRNRKDQTEPEPRMHGGRDIYDPPPPKRSLVGTITVVEPLSVPHSPIDHSTAANCRACGSRNTQYTGDCSIVCLDCYTEGGPGD